MKRHGDIIVVDEHYLLHVAGIFKVEDPHIVGIADGAAYAVGVKVVARVVVYLGKNDSSPLWGSTPSASIWASSLRSSWHTNT